MDRAKTEWQILGSGTSSGVPLIACPCRVCRSRNPKDKRTRAAVWIQTASRGSNGRASQKSLLIDTSTDLRFQALRAKILRVDAVLYTHPHADHIHGIDELRGYNFIQKSSIPVYGSAWTCNELRTKFSYIFQSGPVEGGGIPRLSLNEIPAEARTIQPAGVPVEVIRVQHGSKECLAYRIDSVAYLTDCSYIPNESLERLKGLDVLILDCVKIASHPTHLNLEQALQVVETVKPKKTFLTHLGHDFGYEQYRRKLPKGVALAYDGLKIRVTR